MGDEKGERPLNPEEVSLRELLEQRISQVESRFKEEIASFREVYTRDFMQFKEQDREARHSLANRMETALSQRSKMAEEQYHLLEVALTRTREEHLRVQTAESERIRVIEQDRVLYVTRDRLEQTIATLELQSAANLLPLSKRLEEILSRLGMAEQAKANMDGRMAAGAAMFLGVSVVVNLIVSILVGIWKAH